MQMKTGPGGAPVQGPQRQVLWFAMTASVFVYGLVGFVITRGREPVAVPWPSWVFPVIALVLAAAAFVLHRRMAESSRGARDKTALRPLEIPVWALDESIAVLGLVGTILASSFSAYPAYAIGALVLLVLHRPQ